MKGLLIKDYKLILNQKNFFCLMIALSVGMLLFSDDVIFPLGFLIFVISLFTISTISYDDYNNGYAFLFTLPITRKGYVKEKYCFGLLLGSFSWILITLFGLLVILNRNTLPIDEFMISAILILAMMIAILAMTLPFQLKFGGEKGRIALIGAFGIIAIIGIAINQILTLIFHININLLLENIPTINISVLAGLLIIIAFICLWISYKISTKIMEHKEF